MNLTQAVAAAFTYLEPRVANYPRDDSSAMRAWVTDLSKAEVTPEELERFTENWAQTEKFMPVPSDILAPIYKARQRSDEGLVIHDPVKTGEHMGVIEIGSRSRCELLGLPFVELRPDELEALPSPETREEAKERLENTLAKVEAKKIKPEKTRAEFFEGEDLEALEKARRMVSAVTG